jgi:hypothetical protein
VQPGPTELRKPLRECGELGISLLIVFAECHQNADPPHAVALLCPRYRRPRRRAPKRRNELPPPHSITSFDHFIGDSEQVRRNGKAECLGGLQVDDELELDGLLHRKIAWLLAFEDAAGVLTNLTICPRYAGP